MTRNRFILLLMVIFALQSVCVSAQVVTRTITDIENGMPVPYAAIYKSDSILLSNASIDGVFSINVTSGSFYKISRLGYEPATLTAEQLLSDKIIKMKLLPYELNEVVVTANSALSDINRALESTRKRIPSAPFLQRCYKKDEIITGNNTVLNAKAIIDYNVRRVASAGKGLKCHIALKGLRIDKNNSYSENIIPIVDQMPIIPINIGFSLKFDENSIYTRLNSDNDSITIITFHPKKNRSSKRGVQSSGRFIIDTKTWCILRYDMTPDSGIIEYSNNFSGTRKLCEYSLSVFYSANCLPSKVEQKTVYYLKDKPNELFIWTVLHVYKDIAKVEYQRKPSGSYDPKKVIFKQTPVTMPDFETKFNQGFQ